MTSMFIITACEKAEIQKSNNVIIQQRAESCDYCPVEDCCCYVELTGGATSADLAFCGTTNPDISTSTCGPIDLASPCDDISGFYWTEALSSLGNPNEYFCVAKGTSFMLGAGPLTGTNIRFHCQVGQTNPQFITLNLSAGEKHYYTVDDDCELSECHLE